MKEKSKETIWIFHTESIYSRGGEKYLYEILKRLAAKYTIVLFLQRVSVQWQETYEREGIIVKTFWVPPRFYWLLLPVTLCINFFKLRTQYDKAYTIFATNFPVNLLAVLLSPKTIIHCFEPLAIFYDPIRVASLPWFSRLSVMVAGILYRWLDKYAVRNCAILTTLNSSVQKHIIDTYDREPDHFIQNGIDTDYFAPKRKRIKAVDPYLIGHSTDYTVFKGTSLLIEALPLVVRGTSKPFEVHVTESIYDERVHKEYLEELKKKKIADYVRFVGNLSEQNMVKFYQGIDVFCYLGSPMCPGGSTASLSVLEAQSCGTPVLRTTGADDEIIHGKSGYLIDEYTPQAVANAICMFLQLPTLKKTMLGKEARNYIRSAFSWDKSAEKLDTVFQMLASIRT